MFTWGTTAMQRISLTLGLSGGDTPYRYPAICVLRSDTVMNWINRPKSAARDGAEGGGLMTQGVGPKRKG